MMGFLSGGNSSSSTTNETNNYDQRVINETSNENDGQFAGSSGSIEYNEIDGGAFDFAEKALVTIVDGQRESLRGLGELQASVVTQGASETKSGLIKAGMYSVIAIAVAWGLKG